MPSAGEPGAGNGGENPGAGAAGGGGASGNEPTGNEPEGGSPIETGGAASEPGGQTSVPEVEPLDALLADYENWARRTEQPVAASAEIFGLCRLPGLAESAFVASEHGAMLLLDWLNAGARAGFDAQGSTAFVAGSAIVKEKLAYREGEAEPVLVAIGLMRKRESGFAPEHGDWEFGYWEEEPGLLQGPEASSYCAGCHASSPTDFVFMDDSWRYR